MRLVATKRIAAERSGAGWDALAHGRWSAAKTAFEAALDQEETPEALEGLSWAAWWLDDAAALFEARERAYRLYRERGESASAARMATWLAADELDFRGAAAVAGGWLRRAHRLLDPLEPGPDHGWLAFHDGYISYGSGDGARSRTLAASAAEIGRRFGVPDLEMLGLALEGAALVAAGEVAEGMSNLDEATAVALEGDAAIPISGAWACCFLVGACTSVLDHDRAYAWCDRIAEFAKRYGSRYMLAFCRGEYGTIDVWRGRWPEAEELLNASVEDFSSSRPAWVASPLATLAELRRRQGRLEEAAAYLDRAGGSRSGEVVRVRLALDQGDMLHAAERSARLLRQIPAERKLERAPILDLLAQALIARDDLDEASPAVQELHEIAELAGTTAFLAGAGLAEGTLASARGDHARARGLLEDAVDRFHAARAPFETARARLALAATLAALGRPEEAEREIATAVEAFVDLGAASEAERARSLLATVTSERSSRTTSGLTPREREVLSSLAEGLTNRQIAARLVVSEHTVHRHVTNILRKLEVSSRTAAAAHAVRAGLAGDPGV